MVDSAVPLAGDVNVKELLYRSEAERLHLQQATATLQEDRQQLSADVHKLQQQLAEAHAAYTSSQQQCQQISATKSSLQLHLTAAIREYRANDIICCGLRSQITSLQQQLSESRQMCKQQASQIATFADDMEALLQSKIDLTQQLRGVKEKHQQLQADHATAVQKLAETHLELEDSKLRWADEHGDIARRLQDIADSKQQVQQQMDELGQQMQQKQQQLEQSRIRCQEFEIEVNNVRDIVMVLAKAIGKQPKGQELPGHEDPVWMRLGPLGGVQAALEVVVKHIRIQDTKSKTTKADLDRLEDRVRSESAQKAELQAGLYEVRGLYSKAIADREALDARATRAEAEKAAADTNWQRAKAQAAEDAARLTELQESVMALTQQVQQLLPLQPRCSTLEVERDTAQHKLDRLQEQHDQLQRQFQQAIAREADVRSSLETYKTEHMQLLAANAQLVGKCQELNKKVQVLEISTREGSLAAGQLESTRQKLASTQNQLEQMSDSHIQTLRRLETAKALLHGSSSGSLNDSLAASPRGSRKGSRATSQVGAMPDSPSGNRAAAGSGPLPIMGSAASINSAAAVTSSATEGAAGAGRRVRIAADSQDLPTPSASASGASTAAGMTGFSSGDGDRSNWESTRRSPSPLDSELNADELDHEVANLPPEVAALLIEKGLVQQLSSKQKKWQEIKVGMLSWFATQLRKKLLQQTEHSRQLEVQLLQQEADHMQKLLQQEQATSQQCMAAAVEAQLALQHFHSELLQAISGEQPSSNSQGGSEKSWPRTALAIMISNLQNAAARELMRAQQFAARQDIAVQSDQLSSDWLHHVKSLPESVVMHALHHKAIAEAIVRIYIRALQQIELAWSQQQRQGRPGSGRHTVAAVTAGIISASAGAGADSCTYFDCMMAHYSQQQQGRQVSVQTYDASLWKDPQGPICRLLLSCRSLTATSSKVALFCCFAGTHQLSSGRPWGMGQWQQFLLILHATKRLVGALWKEVLRDWSSTTGVQLPLQCVHDLLGNVYNVSDVSELAQLPAILRSKDRLLHSVVIVSSRPATAHSPAATGSSQPVSAVETGGAASTTNSGASGTAPSGAARGSVSAALAELVVDGPVGPAVDLDDLLAMLMIQFDAGLLPLHPLMQPRRLTDGALSNTTNAWGSAAAEAAGSGPAGARAWPSLTALGLGSRSDSSSVGGTLMPGTCRMENGDWCLQSNASGVNIAAGRGSRPTTGAAETPNPDAGVNAGMLPRIRTPDGTARPSSGGTGPASSGSPLSQSQHKHPHLANIDIGTNSSSSSVAGSLASPSAALSKNWALARASYVNSPGSRVVFKDLPSSTSSSSLSGMNKLDKGLSRGRNTQH